ncbi:YwmB family TATA-box binding protein [Bacillus sp. ISL-35]|uniref:YwmB family TATA-box binding protein n=1 Tax=Bacillus sp. ISL-35 TaxID=2819122 RepID=UPI001BEB6D7B|nr:YwmB family TATA-box binding protein [Bacillus sp. ISL-35]MBT2678641.1 YwmB family TATA-box binding protein [Bacillus sp. ISL-35]MBT2703633.1 YwmB family TATA-box binding protein [Chryseobacterium sp. ISL-80]
MKKIPYILSIFGIIGFIVFQAGNKTTVADADHEIKTLASVLQDEDILITGWSLYARETLEQENVESLVKDLKVQLPEWTWSGHNGELTAVMNSSEIQEKIKIVSTDTKGPIHTYVMYEVRGQHWNKNTETFLNKNLPGRIFDIFRGNATTFSCVEGEINGKIKSALPVYKSKLLKAFNAREVEGLAEGSFISSSAVSPLFDKTLSNEHEMNMQLGLRKTERLGAKTTVVVGTPIITIEY